jgi:hypothetical protein
MLLEISLAEPATESDWRSLRDWLADDPDLGISLSSTPASGGHPGGMSAGLVVAQFIVSTGLQLSALAISFSQWRKARGVKYVAIVDIDGRTLRLESDDADVLTTQLRSLLDKPDDAA